MLLLSRNFSRSGLITDFFCETEDLSCSEMQETTFLQAHSFTVPQHKLNHERLNSTRRRSFAGVFCAQATAKFSLLR